MKTTNYKCDIKHCNNDAIYKEKAFQVIFTTEQTEGRSIKPSPEDAKIDLCEECHKIMCSGKQIFAEGAQGHNTFYFKPTQIHCQCKESDKHGETSIMCCNDCGFPVEEFWTNEIRESN